MPRAGEEARLRLARRDRAGLPLWQIFVHDPSGVMMELTFDGTVENRPTPGDSGRSGLYGWPPFGRQTAKAA